MFLECRRGCDNVIEPVFYAMVSEVVEGGVYLVVCEGDGWEFKPKPVLMHSHRRP